jgi:hypothetical protein
VRTRLNAPVPTKLRCCGALIAATRRCTVSWNASRPARPSSVVSRCVGSSDTCCAFVRSAAAIARASVSGPNCASPSVNSSQRLAMSAVPTCSAWLLPSQPGGSSRTVTTWSRGSSAARRASTAPVPSSLRSSTTTRRSCTCCCASRRRTDSSTWRTSSRTAITTVTSAVGVAGGSDGSDGNRRTATRSCTATSSQSTDSASSHHDMRAFYRLRSSASLQERTHAAVGIFRRLADHGAPAACRAQACTPGASMPVFSTHST